MILQGNTLVAENWDEKMHMETLDRQGLIDYARKQGILLPYNLFNLTNFKNLPQTQKVKGGDFILDTKSRFEVMAELENKKRQLIEQKAGLSQEVKQREKNIRELERRIADDKLELEEFKESLEERRTMLDTLIKSAEDSLNKIAQGKSS